MRSGTFEAPMDNLGNGYWYYELPLCAGANRYWFYVNNIRYEMKLDPANMPYLSPGADASNRIAFNTVYVPYDEKQDYEPLKLRADAENPRNESDRPVPPNYADAGNYEMGVWQYVNIPSISNDYYVGVYLPYGYDSNRAEPYKTIYLCHASGQDECDWMGIGSVQNIMDNLVAAEKTEPAVIITPNINAIGSNDYAALLTEIVPFIEENYNVSTDKMDRALGGLSTISVPASVINSDPTDEGGKSIEKFGYYGIWSGGNSVSKEGFPGQEYSHIMFGGGHWDFGSLTESFVQNLADQGVFCKNVRVAGAHDFNTWSQLFRIWLEDYLWNPEAHGDIPIYTVTVQNDGNGTASTDKTSAAKGETVTLTATPAAGYHFKEWQTSDVTISGNSFTMPEQNVTVTAIFEADAYTVTFDANGGSVTPASDTTGTDGKLASLPTPTRSGSYSFDGWYTAASGGTKVTVDNVYTADTTIYAHWTYTGGGSSGGGGGSSSGGGGGSSYSGSSSAVSGQTYSPNWFRDEQGVWRIKNSAGQIVTNAWLCDDVIKANGKDVWYLLGQDGAMVSVGLVQDNTGNFYSLETEHNGYFGMLRYKNGTYNCNGQQVYLTFNQEHNGSFGAVTNAEGLEKLKAIYGVTQYGIGNENAAYTSSF